MEACKEAAFFVDDGTPLDVIGLGVEENWGQDENDGEKQETHGGIFTNSDFGFWIGFWIDDFGLRRESEIKNPKSNLKSSIPNPK